MMLFENPGFFCAFCKSPRPGAVENGIRWNSILSAILFSVFLSFLIWEELDPRALPLFIVLVMALEFASQIHWKSKIICPHCGFDPVLYVKNQGLAAEKVKEHLERRKQNPLTLLSRQPEFLGMKRIKPKSLGKVRPQTQALVAGVPRELARKTFPRDGDPS
ncbi:MAG: hypothetical protein K2X47_07350 [Bdellovibrionales bacterium]|nr:hypothetical protein [Bdellovibrionales bacterium]